ncbi:MAG: FUN14 domain-containing protein [Candidatus Hadarchaeota archaeon]
MSSVPAEIAWLVPMILPFVIGLLAGVIVKKTAKLLFLGIALIAILSFEGYINISLGEIADKAMDQLPRLIDTGEGYKDVLPYKSGAFLVGLALGLWKG